MVDGCGRSGTSAIDEIVMFMGFNLNMNGCIQMEIKKFNLLCN